MGVDIDGSTLFRRWLRFSGQRRLIELQIHALCQSKVCWNAVADREYHEVSRNNLTSFNRRCFAVTHDSRLQREHSLQSRQCTFRLPLLHESQ